MIELLGWVAAALGVGSSVPQYLRVLRQRSSAGVSLQLWQVSAASTAAWASHGFLTSAPQMQLPNVALSLVSLAIVVFIVRDRKQPMVLPILVIVVLAAALISVELLAGALWFGIVVMIPQLYGQLTQTRALIVSDDLRGVSMGFLAIFLLVQALWFGFGVAAPDWSLIVCAGAMCVIASANLAIYLFRRRRQAKIVLAV